MLASSRDHFWRSQSRPHLWDTARSFLGLSDKRVGFNFKYTFSPYQTLVLVCFECQRSSLSGSLYLSIFPTLDGKKCVEFLWNSYHVKYAFSVLWNVTGLGLDSVSPCLGFGLNLTINVLSRYTQVLVRTWAWFRRSWLQVVPPGSIIIHQRPPIEVYCRSQGLVWAIL